MELKSYWQIVPIGDGYHYLCKDKSGDFVSQRKDEELKEDLTPLVFKDVESSQKFIEGNFLKEEYIPEEFWSSLNPEITR